jgi:small subunit ribosomal protein S5
MGKQRKRKNEEVEELDERVVDIARVAKVIKGGRRFSFRTTIVVGDNKGRIGIGIGKARAVPDSIRKASERARRNMVTVAVFNQTVPYGGGVRAVLEVAGVHNILSKSQGSSNTLNVAMATLEALKQLRSPETIAEMRGKQLEDVLPFWERAARYQQRRTLDVVKQKQQDERKANKGKTAGEVVAETSSRRKESES